MAGPNIGNVEITVDANTGRLRAQIIPPVREIGREAGEALEEGISDVEGNELIARIRVIAARMQRVFAGVNAEPTLHDTTLRAQIHRLQIQLRATPLDVPLTPDIDFPDWVRDLLVVEQALGEVEAQVAPIIDRPRLLAVLALLDEILDTAVATVGVELNEADMAFVRARLGALGDGATAEIDVDISGGARRAIRGALTGTFQEASDDAEREGFLAGAQFADSFVGGLSRESKLIAFTVTALADTIAVGLQGALAALTAVASSAFEALVGGALAAAPAIAALGGAVTALLVGLENLGGAFSAVSKGFDEAVAAGITFSTTTDDIQEAMAGLSPAAQDFVQAFADVLPALSAVRSSVQESLVQGLGDTLRNLTAQQLPGLETGLVAIADRINESFQSIADTAAQIDLTELFTALIPIIDSILSGFERLAQVVIPFLVAAAPAGQALADSFEASADSLADMIQAGAESGQLETFLLRGVESLRQWFDLIEATSRALFTLFSAGADSGDSFVVSLTDIINRFNDWMNTMEGQSALIEFFESGESVMSALVPILDGLKDAFSTLVTPETVDNFGRLAASIGAMLPSLGELLAKIGEFQFSVAFVDALAIAFQTLADLLDLLPDFVVTAIGQFVGMASAFKLVGGAVSSAVNALTGLVNLMVGLAPRLVTFISSFGSFAPLVGGLTLAVGILTTAFLVNSQAARKAAAEIQEYADALNEAEAAGSNIPVVEKFLSNIADESADTRQAFKLLGLDVEQWAEDVVDGTSSAAEGIASMLERVGPAGREIAELLRSGVISAEEFATRFEQGSDRVFDAQGNVVAGLNVLRLELGKTGIDASTLGDVFDALATEEAELNQAAIDNEVAHRALAEAFLQSDRNLFGFTKNARIAAEVLDHFTGTDVAKQALDAALGLGAMAGGMEIARVALEAEAKAAEDAAVRQQAFQDRLEDINTEAVLVISPLDDVSIAFEQAADAADKAADDAERLQEVFEDFIDPALNAQEAAREMAQEFADFGDLLKTLISENALSDIITLLDDGTAAINLNTQAGRDFAEGLEGRITTLKDTELATIGLVDAETGLAKSGGQAAAELVLLREQLVDQIESLGLSEEAARGLVDAYGLTPESIVTTFTQTNMTKAQKEALQLDENLNGIPDIVETIISMPGITEAQAAAVTYDEDLDQIPDVIDTEFTAPTLREVKQAVRDFDEDLDGIPDTVDTEYTSNAPLAQKLAQDLGVDIDTVGKKKPHIVFSTNAPGVKTGEVDPLQVALNNVEANPYIPTINLADNASAGIATTQEDLDFLGGSIAIPTINLADNASDGIATVGNNLADLDGRSATITINERRVTENILIGAPIGSGVNPNPVHGGQVGQFGAIAGEAGMEFARIGSERFLLTGPTAVPPGTMVTSAALTGAIMRKLMQEDDKAVVGPRTIINQNFTLTAADPAAVAVQAMNRAAALSH